MSAPVGAAIGTWPRRGCGRSTCRRQPAGDARVRAAAARAGPPRPATRPAPTRTRSLGCCIRSARLTQIPLIILISIQVNNKCLFVMLK